MTIRRLSGAALTVCLAACSTVPTASETSRSPGAGVSRNVAEFRRELARLEATQPRSPEHLSNRLNYAELLAAQGGADCARNLDEAQSQLDRIEKDEGLSLVLSSGAARVADLDYRIHIARATCGDESLDASNLLAAEVAAERAVDLYRDALDYRSMVNMKFNVAVARRARGDQDGAVAAVEAAIALDREYGFLEDARDNYASLQRWNAAPQVQARVAALIQDFPIRSVTFNFNWRNSDADISVDTRQWRQHTDGVIATHLSGDWAQSIRGYGSDWRITTEGRDSSYELGTSDSDEVVSQELMMLFARSAPRAADYVVNGQGQFARAMRIEQVSGALNEQAEKLESARWGSIRYRHLAKYASQALTEAIDPAVLEAKLAEAQSFLTAAWNGATLEQGVWYESTATLFLPGTAEATSLNRVEFSYTRSVPCTSDAAESSCAEIVVHFAPVQRDLAASLAELTRIANLPAGRKVDYQGATYLRIVTDPATLMPYAFERRSYSYVSAGRKVPDEANELERSSIQFNYKDGD